MQNETNNVLDQILAEYLRADERGQPLNRQEVLEKHPQRAEELREFFADRDRFTRTARPQRQAVPITARSFGDYELLEEIARGGMGIVYKAKQTSLGRTVAVKMILAGHLASAGDVRRFRTEAVSAAGLQHPHIVAIHEKGDHQGRHYFCMDYVDGPNLAELVRDRPLPPRRAAACVKQAAEAVAYAHQQGILHRDLKPSNILIDAAGRVRITDFGLAGRMDANDSLTRSGQILGTPSYMSPEQAEGKRGLIGPQSDVYSLGAVLYELLTGHPPFRADSAVETLHQVVTAEPASPRIVNHAVPRDLETICRKCLEKTPRERYLSAQTLADDLGHYLEGLPIAARPVSRLTRSLRWSRREPAVAGMSAVVVLLMTLMLAVSLFPPKLSDWRPGVTGILGTNDASASRLNEKPVDITDPPHSPETHTLTPVRRLQTHRDGAVRMALSPDGKLLAAGSDNEFGVVSLWDLQSGRFVRDFPRQGKGVAALGFSANGELLASGGTGGEVRVRDVKSGATVMQIAGEGKRVCGLGFTTDGQMIVAGFAGAGGKNIRAWNIADGKLKHKLEASALQSLAVAPGRDGVAAGYVDSTAQDRELKLAPWPPATELARAFSAGQWFGVGPMAFSPSGALLATGGKDQTAVVWNANTAERRQVLRGHSRPLQTLAFAPDGKLLATAAAGWGRDAAAEICVWDPHTGRLVASAEQSNGVTEVVMPQSDIVLSADRRGGVTTWQLTEKSGSATPMPIKLGRPIDSSGWESDQQDEWLAELGSRSLSGSQRLRNLDNGHIYQRIDQPGLTWHEAKRLCESFGGHLATINSAEENQFIYNNFAREYAIWLGGTDQEEEGQWRWVTDEPFSYENWGWGEPSDPQYGSEDYLMMGNSLYNKEDDVGGFHYRERWNDIDSGSIKGASLPLPLCEWEVESEVPPDLPVAAVPAVKTASEVVLDQKVTGGRYTACFSPDGTRIAAVDKDHVRMWAVGDGRELPSLECDLDDLFDVCFSRNGRWIAAAGRGGVLVWDASSGKKVAAPKSENMHYATRVTFSPDSEHLLVGRSQGASIWRTDGWDLHCEMPAERSWFSGVAYSPDGQWLAACGQQSDVVICGKDGEVVDKFPGDASSFFTLAVSLGGEFLAVSGPRLLVVWDFASREVLFSLPRPNPHVAAFSPDGTLLATADHDHEIVLRDPKSGRDVRRLKGHTSWLNSAVFSPDGTQLVTASGNGEVKVWYLATDATAEAL